MKPPLTSLSLKSACLAGIAAGSFGALAGCATTYDVVQVGPQTYQVSAVAAPARGGIAGAQHRATEAANQKCQTLGKVTTVTDVDTGHEFPAAGRAVVTFTCT
jgi:hypothetical protein